MVRQESTAADGIACAGDGPARAPAAAAAGFTLVELMITLAVATILLALAAPSFQSALNRHRLNSAASELAGALQLARSEAIRHNRRVTLCNSSDGSACSSTGAGAGWSGWIVFVDLNADGVRSASEPVVKAGAMSSTLRALPSAGVSAISQRITFRGDGTARAANGQTLLNGTLALCMPVTQPAENVRNVSLASGSRTAIKARNAGGVCSTPSDS